MMIVYFDTIPAKSIYLYVNQPNCLIVDLRSETEYRNGHIPSAVNIEYEHLNQYNRCLCKYKTVVLYCQRGNNSLLAARRLQLPQTKVLNICGGIRAYRGELERGWNNI